MYRRHQLVKRREKLVALARNNFNHCDDVNQGCVSR
jgi:hypothetical protein